jgi:hypothetical protein
VRADLESPDFQVCWDRIDLGAMKNSQRIACLHAERKHLQALLNEQLLRCRQALDPPGAGSLRLVTTRVVDLAGPLVRIGRRPPSRGRA